MQPLNKKIFILTIIIVIVFLYAIVSFFYSGYSDTFSATREITINEKKFTVKVADDQISRSYGLQGKENLCENCGMLFVFPQKGNYPFHMKTVQFTLDIIFILENKIVFIVPNIPVGHQELIGENIISDQVLELNGGTVEKYGIEIGDKIE